MSEQSSNGNRKPPRPPEFEERFGNALAAVFGNFAASSALAARLHQSRQRAAAFRGVAQSSAIRQRAMAGHADVLRRQLDADENKADRFEREMLRQAAIDRPRADPQATEGVVSVALPGLTRDIGLGDAIAKLTAAVGLNHCEGCARRAAALNRALTFRAKNREK